MPTQREWTTIREYDDILFDYYNGIARITINRERYRNAFTPTTTAEMSDALRICREEADIDVIVITGAGDKAFCSGGDQNVKGRGGYIGKDGVPRLSVLDVQKQIRSIPKPVIAAVNGFAIGGGHVLHVVCDLSIASENAIFGQTGPRVGSFDAGFGASYLARVVGQKKAREIWFLCRKYNAQEALDMGLVNKVVPLEQLEDEYVQWAEEMMLLSPLALRMIKAGLNAEKYKKQESWQERKQAQRKESKKMLYQVIGVERKTGDFTPRDGSNRQIHYDNIVFHCVTLKRLVGCAGQKAEQCSIKVVDSADLLGFVGAMDDFSKVIGHQFDLETSYGKIKSWELVK